MATRSVSSEDISGHNDGTGSAHDYFRQMTLNDDGYAALYRPRESRALVRRPSVDFAKLTKKESRAIIDNYFRRSAPPPVLEHMSKEILKKISDTEMGKVDLREARRQLTENKTQLHAEVKRKVARFPSHYGRRRRSQKRAFKPAVDDVSEVQSTLDHTLDAKHVHSNVNEPVHMTTTTTITHTEDHVIHSNKATSHTRSKPILDTPTNPFDLAFSMTEADTVRPISTTHHTQSHKDTEITIRKESLPSEEDEEEDEGTTSGSITLLAATELITTEHTGYDEVDCPMMSDDIISIEQNSVVDDNDVLNRAHNIMVTSCASEITTSRNTAEGDDGLFVQCETSQMATKQSVVTVAPGNRPSKTSTHSLRLELSCNANDECQDVHCSDEDDEQPKSKPTVAETPLEIDGPLPSKFHGIPQFLEVQEFLGRIPTFPEYMAYRLDKIGMDLECRYPELDEQIQRVISTLGNTLTYEVFHKAASNIQSQAKQVYEGVFMVLRFGRQLFQNFPENASYYTTQWVNGYIVHQGGWDAVADRYFEEQVQVMSPMATDETTGASGASDDSGLQMESTDGGALTHVVTGNTSCLPHKKSVNMSPPVWDLMQRPLFERTHLERACSVEFLPSVPEVSCDPETVSPPVASHNDPMATTQLTAAKSQSLETDSDHPHTVTGTASAAVLNKPLYPIRRTNSAPELSHLPTTISRSSSSSDMQGPPPELLERRRGSLQEYNEVFLSYIPYITGAIAPAAAVVHIALNIAQRLSSS